jgi:hypothetical protein
MTIYVFLDDEAGYSTWISNNADGFVVNTRRELDPNYLVLHAANCTSMQTYRGMDQNPGGFTERGYQKICAETADELLNYFAAETGNKSSITKYCSLCSASTIK